MTTAPHILEALAQRVCDEPPSRQLDAEIALAVGWRLKTVDGICYWRRGDFSWTAESGDYPPCYTTSIDAADGERPKFWALMCSQFYPNMGANVHLHCTKAARELVGASAPTEAQARIAANLRALAAETVST